jgi:hypothetical protein
LFFVFYSLLIFQFESVAGGGGRYVVIAIIIVSLLRPVVPITIANSIITGDYNMTRIGK